MKGTQSISLMSQLGSKRTGRNHWHNFRIKKNTCTPPSECNPVSVTTKANTVNDTNQVNNTPTTTSENHTSTHRTATLLVMVKFEIPWRGPCQSKRTGRNYWCNFRTKQNTCTPPSECNPVPVTTKSSTVNDTNQVNNALTTTPQRVRNSHFSEVQVWDSWMGPCQNKRTGRNYWFNNHENPVI